MNIVTLNFKFYDKTSPNSTGTVDRKFRLMSE